VSARIRHHVRAHNLRNEIKTSVALSGAVLTHRYINQIGAGAAAKTHVFSLAVAFSAIPRGIVATEPSCG